MAEPGKVIPELLDQLDGPEHLGSEEAAAVLRSAARHTEKEEKVRERGHVHADGGRRRGHVGRRRVERWSSKPFELLGRDGRPGRHGRAERRPLLRGQQLGTRFQAVQNGPAGRVLDHQRQRWQRRRQ